MEFPELGEHCNEPTCHNLDFLPVKCDACDKIYCSEHMNYERHNCPSAYKKDVLVPICPLCGSPVPTPRNQKPDVAVSEHIDEGCKLDPVKKNKIKINKCSVRGCKTKEMIPVICGQCKNNFCLVHRFPDIHNCQKKNGPLEAALRRQQENPSSHLRAVQGSMSEDEALARALSESVKDADRMVGRDQGTTVNASMNQQRCQVS